MAKCIVLRLRRFFALLSALLVIFCTVSFPSVYAAVTSVINPADHIISTEVDGDSEIVTFQIPINGLWNLYYRQSADSTLLLKSGSEISYTNIIGSAGTYYMSFFPLGTSILQSPSYINGAGIDVSDIVPGKQFKISLSISGYQSGFTSVGAVNYYFYDETGALCSHASETARFSVNDGSWTIGGVVTVPENAKYFNIGIRTGDFIVAAGDYIEAYAFGLYMTADTSIYYENSQTLKAIEAALNEQNDLLGRILAKLTEYYDWSVQSLMGILNSIRLAVTSGFSSVVSTVSAWGQNIVDALTPDEDASQLQEDLDDQEEQLSSIGSALDSVQRPALDSIDFNIGGMIDAGSLAGISNIFTVVMGSSGFANIVLLSFICAAASFFLFGRK